MTERVLTSFVLRGDVLEPEGIAPFRKVPNSVADPDHEPAPQHVASLLRGCHPCEPYPEHRRHHIGVWELYVCRLPVTSQAKAIAMVLGSHWPRIKPSHRRIGELSGLSRGSVDNGIKVLTWAGLLKVDVSKGRTVNTYHPHYPMRDVTKAEVTEFVRWMRLPVAPPEEANPPPRGESTVHVVTPTLHHVDGNRPPRGHEVSNEVEKQAVKTSPGAIDDSDSLMAQQRQLRLGENEIGSKEAVG